MSVAEQAVLHVLRQIQRDGRLAYLMGYGTQSFELLTQAEAERTDKDVGVLRKEIWGNCTPERVIAA